MFFSNEKYFKDFEEDPVELYGERTNLDTFLDDYVLKKYRKSLKRNLENGDVIQPYKYQTLLGELGTVVYYNGKIYPNVGDGFYLHPYYMKSILENERLIKSHLYSFATKQIEYEVLLNTKTLIKVNNDTKYTFFRSFTTNYDSGNMIFTIIDDIVFRDHFPEYASNNLYYEDERYEILDDKYIFDKDKEEEIRITNNMTQLTNRMH